MIRSASPSKDNAKKRKTDNPDRRAGFIESISLQNFMCHDNLKFKFGQHMNFIIGLNGSGKSAILSAIMLALGGRSNITGRARNIKDSIKTGKQKATVEIVLCNAGEGAYKPEIYGEQVIVVREITASGSSSYKLKSENGTIVSTQKSDLMIILNAFDIQVENPVSILTQSSSKEFLLSKNAREEQLYKFYYKGTGLEALRTKYEEFKTRQRETSEALQRKKHLIPVMEKELAQWEKFLVSSKKISELKKELIWASVKEFKERFNQKEKEYIKCTIEIDSSKKELDNCKALLCEKDTELNKIKSDRSDLETSLKQLRDDFTALKNKHSDCKSIYRDRDGTVNLNKRELETLFQEISSLENCIQEQQQKNLNDTQEQRKRREAALQALRSEHSQWTKEKEQLDLLKRSKLTEQRDLQRKIDDLQPHLVQHDAALKKLKNSIGHLELGLKNKVNMFGDHTCDVLQDLQKRSAEFSKPVVGPIGRYLEVVDPRWSMTIEAHLTSKLLRSFCANTHRDAIVLREILAKYYSLVPAIIVCQFENAVHDVTLHKAMTHYPTIFDMLKINHHVVANCLIDQCSIENVILIEDRRAAVELMMNQPPRNCYSAFLPNGDQICLRPYRYYSSRSRKSKSILDSLQESDIRDLKNQYQVEIRQNAEIVKQMREHQSTLNSCPAELERIQKDTLRLATHLNANFRKIQDLENTDTYKDVNCMEEELEQSRAEFASKKAKLQDLETERGGLEEELKKMEAEMESMLLRLRELKRKYESHGNEFTDLTRDKETLAQGQSRCAQSLRTAQMVKDRMEQEVEEARKAVIDGEAAATRSCPRVDTTRSCEEIRRVLNETKKIVEKESKCDLQRLTQEYKEKKEKLKKAKEQLAGLTYFMERLSKMLNLRYAKFNMINSHTETIISNSFVCILQGNGYKGGLLFNRQNETLKMDVAPRRTMSSHSNHGSLSGGERSFVTVAFLLALWENTNMPFRILDEYDVFMDENNRQLSIELFVQRSKDKKDSQVMLLTPLELPQMDLSDHIQIHRMAPPKRIGYDPS